jgi:hypothetical protein
MPESDYDKLFAPAPGSQRRFRERLDSAISAERREVSTLKLLTGGLAAAMLVLAWAPPATHPDELREAAALLDAGAPPARAHLESGPVPVSAVEYPQATPGIRMYWVFR